jgi:isoquinoline 1-oxidoreductase alpha subunit
MQLQINGETRPVDADGDTPLLWVLRDDLGMTGTKYGCGIAQCGACSVLVDGIATRSCVTPVDSVVGKAITTIEAVEQDAIGQRVVEAWVRHQVPQCGYCQSGQVIAATALLKQVAQPSDAEIEASMVNLCRCGTYNAIKQAVRALSGRDAPAPQVAHGDGAHGPLVAGAAVVAMASALHLASGETVDGGAAA